MELHAPESPIHSLEDFAVHIDVVTCGILIADFPTLAQQHPEQINPRLATIDNPEYFWA